MEQPEGVGNSDVCLLDVSRDHYAVERGSFSAIFFLACIAAPKLEKVVLAVILIDLDWRRERAINRPKIVLEPSPAVIFTS